MEKRLALFSIVVTGESHNPTILNPDFLRIRDIVPREWQENVAVTQVITTPPFALVSYANGISVTVENDKIQVVDTSAPEDPSMSAAVQIASKYVLTLPHVRYKAVGINFHGVTEMPSAGDFLKQRFVKTGPWDSNPDLLASVGIRLLYPISENGRVIFDIDAGEKKLSEHENNNESVIIVKANFHRECKNYPSETEVTGYLEHVKNDWEHYQRLIKTVLE